MRAVPFALFLFGGMSYAPVAHGGIVTNGAMPVIAAGIGWFVFGVPPPCFFS